MVSKSKYSSNPGLRKVQESWFGWFRAVMFLAAFMAGGIMAKAADPDPAKGEAYFKANCQTCHSPKLEKDMTGPALMGVQDRWDAAGLPKETRYKWIRNSSSLTSSVPYFKGLLGTWKSVMTAFPNATDEEIDNVFAWIAAYTPVTQTVTDGPKISIDPEDQAQMDNLWFWLRLLMVVVVLILGGIAMQVARLKGFSDSTIYTATNTNNYNGWAFILFLIIGGIAASWSIWVFKDKFIQDNAASAHGADIDRLFWITMLIVMVVFALTNALLFYFAFKYRGTEGRTATFYPENHKLEMIWTAVPAVVLTALVIFGIITWRNVTAPPPAGERTVGVELNGQQFGWNIRYPGVDGKYARQNVRWIGGDNILGIDTTDAASHDDFMANEIVLPVGVRVDMTIKSRDVLHSAYLPHFRVKMDAVPGMPTRFHFVPTITTDSMRAIKKDTTFNYELACTEVCGRGHFSMRRVVKVVPVAEWEAWMKAQSVKAALYYQISGTKNPLDVEAPVAAADTVAASAPDSAAAAPAAADHGGDKGHAGGNTH